MIAPHHQHLINTRLGSRALVLALALLALLAVVAGPTPAVAQQPQGQYAQLVSQGLEHLRAERYAEAAEAFLAAIAVDPANHLAHYNLACAYSRWIGVDGGGTDEEKQELAIAALLAAIDAGWEDIDHMDRDEDLDNIRETQGYRDAIERIQIRTYGPRDESEAEALIYEIQVPRGDNVPALVFCHAHGANPKRAVDALGDACSRRGVALVTLQGPAVVQEAPAGPGGGIEALYGWGEHRVFSVLRTIQEILESEDGESIDPTRVYLGGDEQGAYIAMAAALKRPERFAGVLALAPAFDRSTFETESLRRAADNDLRIFLGVSTNDSLFRQGAEDAAERFESLGVSTRLGTSDELTALAGGADLVDEALRYFEEE